MKCDICRESLYSLPVKSTPCGHLFHSECLNQWSSHKQTCPLCRTTFETTDLRQVFISKPDDHNVESDILQNQVDELRYKLHQCHEEKLSFIYVLKSIILLYFYCYREKNTGGMYKK